MSSLHVKSTGILETHVTWKDVEDAIQKGIGTKARIDKKMATDISESKGFMSRIALVEVHWTNVEDDMALPHKFIVKIASQIPLVALSKVMNYEEDDGFSEEKLNKLSKMTRDCHNREVEAYRLLTRFNHKDVPFTKVYALKEFADENDLKGFIIADYVPNLCTFGMFRSIPADELIPIVRGIATFSALGETLTAEERNFASGPDFLDTLFKELFNEKTQRRAFDGLRDFFGEELQEPVERLINVFWHYRSISDKYSRISELGEGFKLVLNHGDLWQSNLLHTLDGEGEVQLKAIIDWQGVVRMVPGLDISRLFLACLSVQDRRNRGMQLLKIYHQTFTSVLNYEAFSFKELLGSYNLLLPMNAMLILPGILPFFKRAQVPEEDREEFERMFEETMIGMMEDVLNAHDYNLKHFEGFVNG